MKTAKLIATGVTILVPMLASEPALCNETTAANSPDRSGGTEASQPKSQGTHDWTHQGDGGSGGNPWGAALAIFGVLGAAGASSVVLKKRGVIPETADGISILASKAVAPKTKVVLLGTRNREVLISVGEHGATLLTEWLAEENEARQASREFKVDTQELKLEEPVEADAEALLALSRRAEASDEAPSVGTKAESRTPVPEPRLHSEAVAGLLELRRRAQNTPAPKPVMKSKVSSLETESAWTRRLMAQMRVGTK
ncbi:MAG: FliO/MopB family protein [Deltaproteobacteria bacterium]|nr:FliO/MopB family protein [Deltaproteobacteria bacterium]